MGILNFTLLNFTKLNLSEIENSGMDLNEIYKREIETFKKDLTLFVKEEQRRSKVYDKDLLNSFYLHRTQEIVRGRNK